MFMVWWLKKVKTAPERKTLLCSFVHDCKSWKSWGLSKKMEICRLVNKGQ
jgi:hypothetical protein